MTKHIHQYVRIKTKKGSFIFKCNRPACNHYVHELVAEGRQSICYRCGDTFILDKANMELAKPHCKNCTVPKASKEEGFDKLRNLVESLD